MSGSPILDILGGFREHSFSAAERIKAIRQPSIPDYSRSRVLLMNKGEPDFDRFEAVMQALRNVCGVFIGLSASETKPYKCLMNNPGYKADVPYCFTP